MAFILKQLLVAITIILLAVVMTGVFTREPGTKWWTRGKRYHALLILLLASLSIGVGFVGFLTAEFSREDPAGSITVALYEAVQHIFLNAPAKTSDNYAIEISRLFGIATVVLVAYEALTRLFADSIQRLLLQHKRGHVVICGLGRIGIGLVQDLRDRTHPRNRDKGRLPTVVVIERDRNHDHLQRARELGAIVVHGDATDSDLLLRVRAEQAECVFFVTGADETNIEGAYDLIVLLGQREGDAAKRYPPRILVHLLQPELGIVLEKAADQMQGPGTANQPVDVVSFNGLEQTALDLVTRQLVPSRPTAPQMVAHFVVVGFGPVGQTVALKLAELAHFENLKRSRMTIVHRAEERDSAERFRAIYPRLIPGTPPADPWSPDPAMDDWTFNVQVAAPGSVNAGDRGVEFVINGAFVEDSAAPESDEFVARIAALARAGNVRPYVFICRENEETNCTLAQELRSELDGRLKQRVDPDGTDQSRVYKPGVEPVTVFAYVPRRPMLTKLTACPDLIAFGACREVCSYDALTWPLQRPLAEAIARQYHQKRHEKRAAVSVAAGNVAPPATPAPAFAELSSWERQSNLSAAAHVNVKLATIGYRVAHSRHAGAGVSVPALSSEQRNVVARMEHNRWVAERLLAGWSFGASDDSLKQRPALVDWANLGPGEWVKDQDQVDQIVRFCAAGKPFVLEPVGR